MRDDTMKSSNNIQLDNIGSSAHLDKVSENRKKYVNHQYVNYQYVDHEEKTFGQRAEWNNKIEFILSIIGYAVGLGNIWRFPYLAYKNGGGSFLIPYFIMLFGTGLPLFFLELALGQYAGQGPTKVFGKLAPAFKGLGFSMLLVAFLVSIYYNIIIAWSLYYLGNSFSSTLPWSYHPMNGTNLTDAATGTNATNATYFFYNVMLGMGSVSNSTDSTEWVGDLQWQLVVCLFSAWALVGICLIKGINSVGKAVYVTAIFPFLILIILFGYGVSLPGAKDGILKYVTPNSTKLLEIDVWADAASQVFYSLGPCFGGLISVSSYNKFNNNCHRDAILVALINSATSIFSGFIIFAVLGFMAQETGKDIDNLIQEGPALVFIVYPEAISHMPVPQLWSVLFFLMLITLGLDSMFIIVEVIITTIMDHFRSQLDGYKYLVVIGTCVVGFVLGLSMCTSSGLYVFQLMDRTCASWNLILLALLEVILVAWIYGPNNFLSNVKDMDIKISKPVKIYWKVCLCFIAPATLFTLIIIKLVQYKPIHIFKHMIEGGEKAVEMSSPTAVQVIAWLITLSPITLMVVIGIYQIWERKRQRKPIGLAMFQPTHNWKPVVERVIIIEDMYLKRRSRNSFRPHLPKHAELF